MSFDVVANPFAVLDLPCDAPSGVVSARARQLSTPEAAHANRTLLAPRSRLLAELGYLPGASAELANQVLDALRRGILPDLRELSPAGRANVLAHRASAGFASVEEIQTLLSLQDAAGPDARTAVMQGRVRAGLPPVSADMLDDAITALADVHADAFAAGLLAAADGVSILIDQFDTTQPNDGARLLFLRRAAATWDRAVANQAARLLEEAIPLEVSLRCEPAVEQAESLAALVGLFGRKTAPLRMADHKAGLPHPASDEAARRWWQLAIKLNNDYDACHEAVSLLRALASWPGLAGDLAEQVRRDLDTCTQRLVNGEGSPELRRLRSAIDAATKDASRIASSLVPEGHLSSRASLAVKELHRAFTAAAASATSGLPWTVLRDFTLKLHNELALTDAALSLIELMLSHATKLVAAQEVLEQLRTEHRALRLAMLEASLRAAMAAQQTGKAIGFLEELLQLADNAAQRQSYQAALQSLEAHRTTQQQSRQAASQSLGADRTALWVKRGIMLAACAVGLLISASKNVGGPQPAATLARPNASAPYAGLAAPDPDAGRPERQPVPGTAVFTRAELRWCKTQKVRADAGANELRLLAGQPETVPAGHKAAVDAFNAFIASLNALCSSYKFKTSDGSVIETEMKERDQALQNDGRLWMVAAYQQGLAGEALHPSQLLPSYTPADPTNAFLQGQVDRRVWEAWLTGLNAATRAGAKWWSDIRSNPPPKGCAGVAAMTGTRPTPFAVGCAAAEARLADPDRRRRSEPEYHLGWSNP